MKNDQHIDDLFRTRLQDFEMSPPEHLWDRIEPQASKPALLLIPFFVKAIASVAAVLAIGVFSYLFYENQTDSVVFVEEVVPVVVGPETQLDYILEPNVVAENQTSDVFEKSCDAYKNRQTESTILAQEEPLREDVCVTEISSITPSLIQLNSNIDRGLQGHPISEDEDDLLIAMNVAEYRSRRDHSKRDHQPDIAVGISGAPSLFSSKTFSSDADEALLYTPDPKAVYANTSLTQVVTFTDSYNPTINIGLAAEIEAIPRFSLCSGIFYNSLSLSSNEVNIGDNYNDSRFYDSKMSDVDFADIQVTSSVGTVNFDNIDLSTASMSSSFSVHQKVDYIEIPLHAKYKFIATDFLMSVVGGINTNIKTGSKATFLENGSTVASTKIEDLFPVIFSSSLGLEFAYLLTEQFIVSLEPNAKFYLSSPSSIYGTSIPPCLSMYAGLRYLF